MRTIALISCGKSKRRERSPAHQLYTGALFKKCLTYAQRTKADEIYILSANYGLIELTQEIAPYIEGFYNQVRRHSAHDFLSPAQFERKAVN